MDEKISVVANSFTCGRCGAQGVDAVHILTCQQVLKQAIACQKCGICFESQEDYKNHMSAHERAEKAAGKEKLKKDVIEQRRQLRRFLGG